jgi:hypothetical protein
MTSANEDEKTTKSCPANENTNLKEERSPLQPLERLTSTSAQQQDDQTAVPISSNHDEETPKSKAERTFPMNGHRAAVEALFNASAEDLNASYRPGATERPR